MVESKYDQFLEISIETAKAAGEKIKAVVAGSERAASFSFHKLDNTPVSKADEAAHELIFNALNQLTPEIPILSEEGEIVTFSKRQLWNCYWLIDPLDGTRGFLDGRDEFTVNIAFIENHQPVLGVVYAPMLDLCYYGIDGRGAFKQQKNQQFCSINARLFDENHFEVLFGVYLKSPHLLECFSSRKSSHVKRLNSSLKFCWIAEGKADLYPRLGDTNEWDTAAAQCVLKQAGGTIIDLNGDELRYNCKKSLLNPPFLAMGDSNQKEKILELFNKYRGSS